MIGALLKFFIVGLIGIIVISIALALLGAALGIVGILLFKVLPIMIVGYVILRIIAPKQKRLSDADREWLES